MTFGEAVTEAVVFMTGTPSNASSTQINDPSLREIVWRMGQRIFDKLWRARPVKYRLARGATGALTVGTGDTGGMGTMPADYSNPSPTMKVYINGEKFELLPRPEHWIMGARQRSPSSTSSRPRWYCLSGATALGLHQIWTFPKNSVAMTLYIEGYVPKPPVCVDRPLAPVLAAGAAGALTGAYTYRLTFVTSVGETEGGVVSNSVTLAAQRGSLTGLPVSLLAEVTSRNLYRTASGGSQHKLVAALNATDTTYIDNAADGTLTTNVPTATTAITGLERLPVAAHRPVFLELILKYLKRDGGDPRTAGEFEKDCITAAAEAWREDSQAQVRRREPRYGRRYSARGIR